MKVNIKIKKPNIIFECNENEIAIIDINSDSREQMTNLNKWILKNINDEIIFDELEKKEEITNMVARKIVDVISEEIKTIRKKLCINS
ncbi:MAG: hypothetical protein HRT99_04290 [Mycoplasmatales bacterium]|nr:hypothetical protein [Mycoplasmatales bacterium]